MTRVHPASLPWRDFADLLAFVAHETVSGGSASVWMTEVDVLILMHRSQASNRQLMTTSAHALLPRADLGIPRPAQLALLLELGWTRPDRGWPDTEPGVPAVVWKWRTGPMPGDDAHDLAGHVTRSAIGLGVRDPGRLHVQFDDLPSEHPRILRRRGSRAKRAVDDFWLSIGPDFRDPGVD